MENGSGEPTTEMVMTSEEAFAFVRDVLGVTSPKDKMVDDPKSILEEIVFSWQETIPYQTVRGLATPNQKRHRPTLLEIKNDNFKKFGGRCYHNNVGCYMVIKAMGFRVTLVPSDVVIRGNHVVMIVYDLTAIGSKHIADVATGGWPTFHLISLDFEKESPEYRESFLRYKFAREGDVVRRLHNAESDPAGANYFKESLKDGWYTYADIHVDTPVEVSHFDDMMTSLYTKLVKDMPFLCNIWCLAFPQGRFVCIRNTTLLVEGEDGAIQKTYFKSRDEMMAAFARHFPQFPKDVLNAAMDDENVQLNFNRK